MKFSCEKAILLSAINTASRAVSSKSSIPALEGLLLQGEDTLTVSGYNMQTGIRTKVDAEVTQGGTLVVNARLFGDIIRRMPDDVIVFDADEKLNVQLSSGDTRFEITALSADDYPELPEVEDEYNFSIPQKTLKAMINQTIFAVSTNEARPVHTGSLFEIEGDTLTVVSVDGFRLALRREKITPAQPFRFVAPGGALSETEKICQDGTELICRRLEGEFLDYRSAIPRSNPVVLTVEAKALITAVDRVSVVISDKMKSPVRCRFENDCVTLTAKTGSGEARDVCRLSGNGDGLEIGFNNRYLLEALRFAPAERLRLEMNTGISPAILVPTEGEEDFLYMVLPVRLKGSDHV